MSIAHRPIAARLRLVRPPLTESTAPPTAPFNGVPQGRAPRIPGNPGKPISQPCTPIPSCRCPTMSGNGVQGEAVFEMRVGLSQSGDRTRLQIGWSCGGQEPSW
jgi:hypothetical protein